MINSLSYPNSLLKYLFAFLVSSVGLCAVGILTVSPSGGDPGETIVVTMTLDNDATPPPPPDMVQPASMTIGSIVGTSVSRSGAECSATFEIPADQSPGAFDAKVFFTTRNGELELSLEDGFTVAADPDAPPTITEDPENQSIVLGEMATFTVVATGADPLTYQWQKDEVDIPSATGSSYSIYSVAESDEGAYRCVVANDNGSVTSSSANLNPLDLSAPLERPYTIVDTGQRRSYNNSTSISAPDEGEDFYGQDSQYRGNQSTYITSADGKTVYDFYTGLTWTQTPDLNGDGTIDVNDKKEYADAVAYVATLNAANYGGYSDWRLPSIKEIYSLMDFTGTDPTSDDESSLTPFIDTDYFDFAYGDSDAGERTIDAQFATTSIYVDTVFGGATAMFGLNLADGRIKGYGISNPIDFYVLFCRGNTDYGVNDFTDNGDDTVTDNATGLMWQQGDSGAAMLWKESLAYAESSTHAGYDDWRLPNAKELHSILDYTRSPATSSSPAIDPVFDATEIINEGGVVDYPWYYTSTTHAQQGGGAEHAVYICFGRATGYFNGEWQDVHGAGAQRSDLKVVDSNGYTYVADGWYFTESPQGDATRYSNYVRLVRDAPELVINEAPTLSLSGDQSGTSGVSVSIENFATASDLADGESVLNYSVSVEDTSLFSIQPAISTDGTLTFTADSDIFATTTVTVTVQDDGGTSNGGVDTSEEATFVITVRSDYTIVEAAFDPDGYASLGGLDVLSGEAIEIDTDSGSITGAVSLISEIVDTDENGVEYRIFCFDSVEIELGATVTISGSLPVAFLSRDDLVIDGDLSVSGADGTDASSVGAQGQAGGDANSIALVSDRELKISGTVSAAGGHGGQGGASGGTFPLDLVLEGAGGNGGDGGIITLAGYTLDITGTFDVSGGDGGDSGAANGVMTAAMGASGGTSGNLYLLNSDENSLTVDVTHGAGGSGFPDGMDGTPYNPDDAALVGQVYYSDAPSYIGINVYHVDASRSGSDAATQDGLSWATAFADLQDALASVKADDEIWIAAGVYYPDEAEAGIAAVVPDNVEISFNLVEDVAVYGGFDGTETSRDERDWEANVVILSGDIDQNDIKVNDVVVVSPETNIIGSNAETVVFGILTLDTVLDGVTITAGYGGFGGGILGGGTYRHCVIQGNYGTAAGGVYHEPYASDERYTLIECDVLANTGEQAGGISIYGIEDAEIVSCRIQGNTATSTTSASSVGGIRAGIHDATIVNCVISGNVGARNGGVVMRISGHLRLDNSTISGNFAGDISHVEATGGVGIESTATCELNNSVIWGNFALYYANAFGITTLNETLIEGSNPGGNNNIDGTDAANDPQFLSPISASSTASTSGDFRVTAWSPLVDAGDDIDQGPDIADLDEDGSNSEALPYDIAGNTRKVGDLDIGAYELQAADRLIAFEVEQSDSEVSFDTASFDITGNAGNFMVGSLSWENALTGASGFAAIDGTRFSISSIALDFGLNLITLTALNEEGVETEEILSITRSSTFDGSVIYVDVDTPVEGAEQNGRSWDSAFEDLQDALAVADGHEIRVARGTYFPDEAAAGYATVIDDDRNSSFVIPAGVSIYGGYWGYGANSPDERNGSSNLHGDLDQDDELAEGVIVEDPVNNTKNNNAYTVIQALDISADNPTLLDGVYITAGRADSYASDQTGQGAGLYMNGAKGLTLNNVNFTGNYARQSGGGMYVLNSGDAVFTDCAFAANVANTTGGAAFIDSSTPVFEDCYFVENRCSEGGAVYIDDANVTMSRCEFIGNTAEGGAAVYVDPAGQLDAYSSLFSGNGAIEGGAIVMHGSVDLENCTLASNHADSDGGAIYAASGSSLSVFNSIIAHNVDASGTDTLGASIANLGTATAVYGSSLIRGSGGSASWESSLGVDQGDNIDVDPQFIYVSESPSSTGTLDGDYRILASSPANDAGNNTYVTGSFDVEGDARIYNSIVDMGAYEQSHGVFFPELTITNGESRVVSDDGSIDVEGTANAGVTGDITWVNLTNGKSGTFTAEATWSLLNVSYKAGENIVTFTGSNSFGNEATVSVTITRVGDVLFVDANTPAASEDQDGTTWETAYADPQDAFDEMGHAYSVWIAEGTYIPATGESFDVYIEEGYLYGGFESGMSSLDSRDHEAFPVVFDGDGESRLIMSIIAEDFVFDGVQLVNAVASSTAPTVGIEVDAFLKDIDIRNCSFSNISSTGVYDFQGLALKVSGDGARGELEVSNCSFVDINTGISGSVDGAGLYVSDIDELMLTDTAFQNNTKASGAGEIYGGAVYFGTIDLISIVDCEFTNNGGAPFEGSARGGAIAFEGATTASVEGCLFDGNYFVSSRDDGAYGGAAVSIDNNATVVTFDRCEFVGNSFTDTVESRGGAVFNYSGNTTLRNCLFYDNSAEEGGAIYFRGGSSTASNCTIVENTATASGGGVILDGGSTVENSIVYDNVAPSGTNISVIETGSAVNNWTNSSEGGDDSPIFVDAVNDDFRIESSSPCVNAGANASWMDGASDLGGNARVFAQRVDIGAYEANDPLIVDADTDSDGVGDFDELVVYGSDVNAADSDRDGMDDGAEVIAGTDPSDAGSILSLTISTNAEGDFEVTWPTVEGRIYTLYGTTDLSEPFEDWDNLGTYDASTLTNLVDVIAEETSYFFQVTVEEGTLEM